jgi:hypothetical protein
MRAISIIPSKRPWWLLLLLFLLQVDWLIVLGESLIIQRVLQGPTRIRHPQSTKSRTTTSTTTELSMSPPLWSTSTNGEKERNGATSPRRSSPQQRQQQEQLDLLTPAVVFNPISSFGESQVFDSEDPDDWVYALEPDQQQMIYALDEALRWTPMVIPFLAYVMFEPTAALFAAVLDNMANNNWVAVDGGAYQAKIIAPAINGVVVPAISILFANLIGTTISTLRQRQLDIRTAINMEAGQLRILRSMLDVFPVPKDKEVCQRYLTQYTSRLIAESQPTVHVDSLDYSLDTELNGFLAELNRLAVRSSSLSTSSSSSRDTDCPPDLILANAYTACSKLYEERAKRITALRSLFPALHFIIVTALAVSICTAFLLETDQDILVFFNAIQLRLLWTILVGTFSALGLVCFDLGNPFRGSYQISKSVDQLYTIRLALRASLLEYQDELVQQQRQTPLL